MTGRQYYLTTDAAWRRHAHHFVEAHFIVLGATEQKGIADKAEARAVAVSPPTMGGTHILILIIADEAAHTALENDPEFEALPHPLACTPVSERVAVALASLGVLSGDDTLTVAEKVGRVNPLLRHRVF